MKILARIVNWSVIVINSVLEFIRVSWRPAACIGMAGSVIIHGIYLPLSTGVSADLIGLTGLITAVVAGFAIREYGKLKGTIE